MEQHPPIATLRARVSALVDQEAALLTRAFELSRSGDRGSVDALFAQVQSIQLERNSLKKQIGNLLGNHRMHVASEVWKPGVYDYRREPGGAVVRVRVLSGPLGLQVQFSGEDEAFRLETMEGTFDGPFAVDEPLPVQAAPGAAVPRPRTRKAAVPARLGKKKQE